MTTEHQPVAGEPPIHRARYSLAIHEGARDDCRLCDIHDAGSQAPAPLGVLAGREQRRRATANILARIDRSKRILEDEATLLRTLVTAEQADGDQACEQRDQAAASLTDLRNDLYAERRAHEEHRRSLAVLQGLHPDADWLNVTAAVTSVLSARDRDRRFLTEARRLRNEACALLDSHQLAMSKALGLGTSAPWDAIAERAQAALRGEAESVRAREAAEAERDASSRFAEASGTRAYRADAEARRNRAAWRNARRRAREVSADYAGIVARRAEAEASRDRWKAAAFEQQERASAAEQRAERAEATLTAIRAAVASCKDRLATGYGYYQAITAALGDPQPATEPTPAVCCVCGCPDVTYHNCNGQPFCCRCAMCCDPPKLCTHGCQPPAEAEHTCPDGEPCPVPGHDNWTEADLIEREQPTEDDLTTPLVIPAALARDLWRALGQALGETP
jgi:hypothetical protein